MSPSPYIINIFGAPGTGKTRSLIQIFTKCAAQLDSTDAIAAVTYTRAAAQVFAERAAEALGLPERPWRRQSRFPHVGTIHSLCYKRLNTPRLATQQGLYDFARGAGIVYRAHSLPQSSLDAPYTADEGDDIDELSAVLRLAAIAAHRLLSPSQAIPSLPQQLLHRFSPERLIWGVQEYTDWKKQVHVIDYEDMLVLGRAQGPLPGVRALLVDEAQDQSPLLWSVIDAWSSSVELLVQAGDPWQALYIYNGADPQMFLSRPGTWKTLATSHRLSPKSVSYAQNILLDAGWNDPRITAWHGTRLPPPLPQNMPDTHVLYLARTHRLVKEITKKMHVEGVPYVLSTGGGPLTTRAAKAYRILSRLYQMESVPAGAFSILPDTFPKRDTLLAALSGYEPDAPVYGNTVRAAAGTDLPALQRALPWYDYFSRVEDRYGLIAFEPHAYALQEVGTIHASKGREADAVFVMRNWGVIPSRAMYDPVSRMNEACVAYVAASRHLGQLSFLEGQEGPSYPFPSEV